MTLRIPKTVLIGLGVLLLAGAGIAVYFSLIKSGDSAKEEAQRQAAKCRAQVGHLLKDAQELDSRLAVGLPFADYTREVGNISVAYNEINPDELDSDCGADVAIHLEEAMNSYIAAENIWNDCIVDFSCSTDSIDPELQKDWFSASANIDVAEHGLEHMAEPGSPEETPVPFGGAAE